MKFQPFGHIVIEPKRKPLSDVRLTDQPREGFTAWCARRMNTFVPVDDVSDREAQALVQRGDLLAALVGVRAGKQNGAIRRAVTL